MTWIAEALQNARPFDGTPDEDVLIAKLVQIADTYSGSDRPPALAAAFDLLIAAQYYGAVAHMGWLYCALPEPVLFYPYTNTCPRCIQDGKFVFHRANKPRSGAIGSAASRLLGRWIEALLAHNGRPVEVLRGREPVDAIFVDHTTTPTTVFFAEIKASPLMTPPLVVPTQVMIGESGTGLTSEHHETDLTSLYDTEMFLFLSDQRFSLGTKSNSQDTGWAYRGLIRLLDDSTFFPAFLTLWQRAFDSYQNRATDNPAYWLTNGSGQPVPRPDDWPRRSGTGYESVSDSKTSVGMDRTDDIKKATYQVLKLGAEGKPSSDYNYKTGIVSNIYAVRHFDAYLESLVDIVWTREATGKVSQAGDLAPETQLFNLFDGIITLTNTLARDAWVRDVFRL